MKNRKCIGLLGTLALVLLLLSAGCDLFDDSEKCTVTFSPGEGSGTPPKSQRVKVYSGLTLPGQGTMIAPEGKIFRGWMWRGGGIYGEGASVTIDDSGTLTAIWAGRTTVTFDPGEGGGTPPNPVIADEYGGSLEISLPGQGDMTAPEGKNFQGWRSTNSITVKGVSKNDFLEGDSVTISSSNTFTAQWADIIMYTVTFSLGTGVSGTPPGSMTVESGTTITLPGVEAQEGKVFQGWSGGYKAGDSIAIYRSTNFTAQWTNKKYAQEGIYVSLISFAGNAAILQHNNSNDFVFLDSTGKSSLSSILTNSYRKAETPGTALFYGVHKGMENLTKNEGEFPTDISSVNLITFTDGLDNGSFLASNTAPIEGKNGVTSTAYATYVHGEIGNRKINGKSITAYSVGVKGADVGDVEQFAANLGNIASQGNVKQITDFNELETVFTDIADTLTFASHFAMTTTGNDPGTIVRMTFDVTGTSSAEAAASSKYLEGALTYADNTYTLTNVAYGSGITSDINIGATIPGTISGDNVTFLFRNIQGYDPATATVQQWTKPSAGSTTWQRNSEYKATGSTSTSTVFIQLVLDASTSLEDDQIKDIRTAVDKFIATLHNRVSGSK